MSEDLKKPKAKRFSHRENLIDSGLPVDSPCAPITMRECELYLKEEGDSYQGMLIAFLLRRVKRLAKEIRDLKATLDESAANGGAWLV